MKKLRFVSVVLTTAVAVCTKINQKILIFVHIENIAICICVWYNLNVKFYAEEAANKSAFGEWDFRNIL